MKNYSIRYVLFHGFVFPELQNAEVIKEIERKQIWRKFVNCIVRVSRYYEHCYLVWTGIEICDEDGER